MELIAFEMIGYAGDAMFHIMEAFDQIALSNMDLAKQKLEKAKLDLNKAHQVQTNLISQECENNQPANVSLIMVHAQNHLMNTMLACQMAEKMMQIMKKEGKKNE